jgi:glycosyltransferase involved in cell wall biosynthesis
MRRQLRDILPAFEHHEGDGLSWLHLIHKFPPFTVAHTAALIGPDTNPAIFQRALALAPTRMLAYDAQGERFHLHPRQALSSLRFLTGTPVHEVHWRPWRDQTIHYPGSSRTTGREHQPHQRTIAVLSPYIPWPLSHGGAVRIFNLLREMAKHSNVVLFCFQENAAVPDLGPLPDFCRAVHIVRKPQYGRMRWASFTPPEVLEYATPAMREALSHESFDGQQTEFTMLASYGGDVLVEHDITMDLARQEFERTHSWQAWWNWRRWAWYERRALRRFPRVVVMSEKDRRQLQHPNTIVLPNGVDLERFQPVPETPGRRLLFVGSFRHYPNALAYRFLVEELWPLPAELEVIAGPDPQLYYPFGTIPVPPGVTLRPFVSDVRPSYARANLVLIPTPVSAGTNIKALEAMAMGRAIVSTSSGMNGLDANVARIANGRDAFRAAILDLLNAPEARYDLAQRGRRYVEAEFGWDAIGRKQRALWE